MSGRICCRCSLLLAVLVGCQDHNHYQIDLVPDGPSIERTLQVWRLPEREEGNEVPPDEVAALARVYPQRLSAPQAARHVFRGRFSSQPPQDIGGAGSYTYLTSSLGDSAIYIERFRGSDDLDSQLYDKRQAADRFTDLVIGWFETQMGQQAHFAALRQFLHQDFRQDMRNVSTYSWLARSESLHHKESVDDDFGMRIAQYFIERDYFQPEQVLFDLQQSGFEDERHALQFVRRLLGRKTGLKDPQAADRVFGFLTDPAQVKTSWENYLQTTSEYRRLLRRWQSQQQSDPDAEKPEPGKVLEEIVLGAMLDFRLFHSPDKLSLSLRCPRQPHRTNGQWNEAARQVTWNTVVAVGTSLPTLCYAIWSVPDAEFQRARFGSVLLEDSELGKYVAWHRSLEPRDARQWDHFVEGLQPGAHLATALRGFSFAGQPGPAEAGGESRSSLADPARKLLLEALEKAAATH